MHVRSLDGISGQRGLSWDRSFRRSTEWPENRRLQTWPYGVDRALVDRPLPRVFTTSALRRAETRRRPETFKLSLTTLPARDLGKSEWNEMQKNCNQSACCYGKAVLSKLNWNKNLGCTGTPMRYNQAPKILYIKSYRDISAYSNLASYGFPSHSKRTTLQSRSYTERKIKTRSKNNIFKEILVTAGGIRRNMLGGLEIRMSLSDN